jgi:hypothetical protein
MSDEHVDDRSSADEEILSDFVPSNPIPFSDQQEAYVNELVNELTRISQAVREIRGSGIGTLGAIQRIDASLQALSLAFTDFFSRRTDRDVAKQVGNFVPPRMLRDLVALLRRVPGSVRNEVEGRALAETIDASLEVAVFAAEDFMQTFLDVEPEYREWVHSRIASVRERLIINGIVDTAREAAASATEAETEARRAATHVRDVAGEEAAGELSEHFATVADEERALATRWRRATVVIALALTAAAAVLLGDANNLSAVGFIRKLAVGLPLAVLGGYSARQASRHRDTYEWARRVDVQLRTMRAFVAPLPQDLQHVVFTMIARHVFAAAVGADSTVEGSARDSTSERLVEVLLDRAVHKT